MCFFLHPTTYVSKKKQGAWNADIYSKKINDKTDRTTILYQASIFNGAGRVFAPRYRQAHLSTYFTKKRWKAQAALDLAYSDIKRAFKHYLEHENNGRPIIIAAHSQGSQHGVRLLQDFFDQKALNDQLVAAYLVGMPIATDVFKEIRVCQKPDDIRCFCSWRTFKKSHRPKFHMDDNNIAAVNPLTFDQTIPKADHLSNKGAILKNFNKIHPALVEAETHNGLLWVNKPRFPGSFLIRTKNYHIADYNLFWVNVRENAILRANAYLTDSTEP